MEVGKQLRMVLSSPQSAAHYVEIVLAIRSSVETDEASSMQGLAQLMGSSMLHEGEPHEAATGQAAD